MRLLFIHMSKCAGRSIQRLLTENYPGKWALWNDGTALDDDDIKEYNKRDLIVGHMCHVSANRFDGYKMITVLRDPLTRTISEYNHLLCEDTGFKATEIIRKQKLSFMDFMRSDDPYIFSWTNVYLANLGYEKLEQINDGENLYLYFLKRAKDSLAKLDFIGIYENMKETIGTLKAKYGIKGELPMVGVTAKANKVAKLEDLTDSEIDEAKAILDPDYEIYKIGRQRLQQDFLNMAAA